jgi:hypothetical protein
LSLASSTRLLAPPVSLLAPLALASFGLTLPHFPVLLVFFDVRLDELVTHLTPSLTFTGVQRTPAVAEVEELKQLPEGLDPAQAAFTRKVLQSVVVWREDR